MMGRCLATVGLLTAALSVGSAPAAAAEVYGQVGTEGIGFGVGTEVAPAFGVRGEINFGQISRTFRVDEIEYDTTFKIGGGGIYGDWFVTGGTFRLSAGLGLGRKRAEGTGRSSATTVVLNGTTYSVAGEAVYADIKFPAVMPYIGVGWGHESTRRGWGFIADLGLMFGKPKVSLTATPTLAAQAGADIEAERRRLQDDANDFRVFPIAKIGVNYRF